jgi:C1A family cysteine protease
MPSDPILAAVQEKKPGWQAGATPFSALDAAAKKARLGLNVTPEMINATKAAVTAANAASKAMGFRAPTGVDWRNNGGNWVTPVKDQQSCGSCVSFATCATIESRAAIVCRNAGLGLNLSENHLFFCGCGNCCSTGWNFAPALNFAQSTGVAYDADSPYTPTDKPCPSPPIRFRITGWKAVYGVPERKASLDAKGPMVAGMAVYEDFYNYQSGVYKHVAGNLVGYHAVCVVGFSESDHCWICKNSWGAGFGEGGFFRIAYGDASGMDTEFAFYEVELACPEQRPEPGRDCAQYVPLLQRVIAAARTDYRLRAGLRYHVCGTGWPTSLSQAQQKVVRNVQAILRECPQYRRAFCAAI